VGPLDVTRRSDTGALALVSTRGLINQHVTDPKALTDALQAFESFAEADWSLETLGQDG
jgi:hypothetical protein